MITYYVRRATDNDLDDCFKIRRLIEHTFRHAGIDQWHDSTEGQRVIRKWVDSGTMRVVTTYAGDVVGTFALSGPDQDFWTSEETREPAIYLYKLMIRPDRRASGLGEAILDYASKYGEQLANAKWLRIDCWKTNTQLHSYFEHRGFEEVAIRTAPGRNSGWLAQRPIDVRSDNDRVRLVDDAPVHVLGGSRYDDPVSFVWAEAAAEITQLREQLQDRTDISPDVALEQAIRALDVRAREQRQRNGMTHRPYTGAQA